MAVIGVFLRVALMQRAQQELARHHQSASIKQIRVRRELTPYNYLYTSLWYLQSASIKQICVRRELTPYN